MKRKKPKFRVGQVIMGRIDDLWVPWVVLKDPDPQFPTCVLVRHRATDKLLLERDDRVRPLTKRERGGK